MLEFKKISLDDKAKLLPYLSNGESRLFTFSFEVLFLWRDVFDFQYAFCKHNDILFIKTFTSGKHFFLFPLCAGNNPKACIDHILSCASALGCEPLIGQITPENKALLEEIAPGEFEFSADRNEFEYIYSTEKLITLSGKKLQPKRNNINFIEKNFQWSVEDITSKNIEECASFSEEWDKTMHEEFSENVAFNQALLYYSSLNLDGLALRINGEIQGVAFGCKLNSDVYLALFEKANPNLRGAYTLLNREFCKRYAQNFRYINRAEDAGVEGLRRAKMSYYPEILQEVYLAKKKC